MAVALLGRPGRASNFVFFCFKKLTSFMAVSVAAAAFVVFFALLDAMDFMARGKR